MMNRYPLRTCKSLWYMLSNMAVVACFHALEVTVLSLVILKHEHLTATFLLLFPRQPPNVQDRYGNRYDPRFHSIPGQYDPENDPRFSDPRYQDPRNLPKYNNNRQSVPKDRYDSKYR